MAWLKKLRTSMMKFYNRDIMGDLEPLDFRYTEVVELPDDVANALADKYPNAFDVIGAPADEVEEIEIVDEPDWEEDDDE